MLTKEEINLTELPLIPLPQELKDLPGLPKEQEEKMRILARHAIEMILGKYKSGQLQRSPVEFKLKDRCRKYGR